MIDKSATPADQSPSRRPDWLTPAAWVAMAGGAALTIAGENLVGAVAWIGGLVALVFVPSRGSPPSPDHCRIGLRSAARGKHLTADEESYMAATAAASGYVHCPDCGRPLASGPCGGANQNYACRHCGSEFSLAVFPVGERVVVAGDRISPAGPRDLGDRACVYGPTPEVVCRP